MCLERVSIKFFNCCVMTGKVKAYEVFGSELCDKATG